VKRGKPDKTVSQEVWDELVNAYYEGVYHYAYRFTGSAAEAEDVTQDTFLTAYQRLNPELAEGHVKGWLYTIARNKCLDRYRSRRRWSFLFRSRWQPPSALEAQEPGHIVQKWVDLLPARQREVFILRQWHGFSTRETAQVLKISEGTVKSHLVRAIERLKELITELPEG
jgi:RNA polymerase sigma-70 factor, ECF subfamily